MSEHLKLMWKFWLMNRCGLSVVTDSDIESARGIYNQEATDKRITEYYVNFQGITEQEEVA